MIQDFLYEIADALIEGSNHAALSRLITQFTTLDVANLPNTKFNLEEAAEAIATNAFPLIARIVALVDSLRTDAWQSSTRRYPERLPSTFGMRIKCLGWILTRDAKGENVDVVAALEGFAEGLKGLVGELVSRKTPYQADLELLKKEVGVKMEYVPKYRFLQLAILLAVDILPIAVGGMESLGRGDYIRAEMACEFVKIGMGGGEGTRGGGEDEARHEAELGVREMLMNWAEGYDEYLREEAGRVLGSLGALEN